MQLYLISIFYITTPPTTNLTDLLSKYHQLGNVHTIVLVKVLSQTAKWKVLHDQQQPLSTCTMKQLFFFSRSLLILVRKTL